MKALSIRLTLKIPMKTTIEIDDSDREQSFFELAGIWEGKNITLDDIRKDAWGKDTFYVASQKNSITECLL
jgi:hypothetical protein